MLFTWTDTRSTMGNRQTTMNQYIIFNSTKANPFKISTAEAKLHRTLFVCLLVLKDDNGKTNT